METVTGSHAGDDALAHDFDEEAPTVKIPREELDRETMHRVVFGDDAPPGYRAVGPRCPTFDMRAPMFLEPFDVTDVAESDGVPLAIERDASTEPMVAAVYS